MKSQFTPGSIILRSMTEDYEIINNKDLGRFELTLEDATAELRYRRDGNRIDLLHTEVPEALGGRGIASTLARHALDYARQEGLEVHVYCTFVATFVKRHPEYSWATLAR